MQHSFSILDNTRSYRNFIKGRYFSEGVRMTAGIALPALVFGYFGMLPAGVVLATGALCVSITDSAGPLHHRANGMFFCILLITLISVISYLALSSVLVTTIMIALFGFVFSMLAVYNARVSSLGVSALLIMILSMQAPLRGSAIFLHALYLAAGGCWYMLFSLLLHTIRPYRIIQQLSGEFIAGVSAYLNTRASFYDDHPDYENTYHSLLLQQSKIQAQQVMLSELLFKTRAVTNNSTKAGRSLLKIYLDVSELFESVMSVYQKYEILHKRFDETGILEAYRKQLLLLSAELSAIADAVSTGNISFPSQSSKENLLLVSGKFESLRKSFLSGKNLEDFIGLGRIFSNIKSLTEKISGLHYYTHFEKSQRGSVKTDIELQKFNEAQNIDPALFVNNLNFGSNIFRHSLRVALSLFAGYLISLFFKIGHSYWILLTIVVILKPAYSLSKSRNGDRLLGTTAGILIGTALLFIVKNNSVLLIIMVLFMAAGYMFIRTKYFISVFFMTVYIVIFFHIIYPGNITMVLKDRLFDTAIGSGIAFLTSLFFVPAWEHILIKKYMADVIQKNADYFNYLGMSFLPENNVRKDDMRRAAQESLTSLANVSEALNRMISEPKRFQKNTEQLYRFVVLNHILTSHFSALAFYLSRENVFRSAAFGPAIKNTNHNLEAALGLLKGDKITPVSTVDAGEDLYAGTDELLEKRKAEIANGDLETATKKSLIASRSVIDQFSFIYNLSADILKNVAALSKTEKALS